MSKLNDPNKESKPDLILHPIRMRIMQCMFGGRRLSPLKLAEMLPDIPQATLYRHIKKLAEAGFLTIAEKNQVRGTIENVYVLNDKAVHVTAEDLANASREDHMNYFTTFVTTLLGDYWRYLQQDTIDLHKDGVSYRQFAAYLNDDEFMEILLANRDIALKYLNNPPAPGRRRRTFTSIIIPDPEGGNKQ